MILIKTDREKCFERIEETLAKADLGKNESDKFKMALNTGNLPYEKTCEYGIKPLSKECPYTVRLGDQPISDEKIPCPENPDSYTVKYPETEEEKLRKYYDDVLHRHEEACLKAAEYKRTHECLPGTVLKHHDPEYSKNILISKPARPQPHKDSPCIKQEVKFVEHPDRCAHEKKDICCEKIPKTTCDCTDYKQLK